MTGRDTIVDTILRLFADRVDTTHVVTNPRVRLDTDTAALTAIVEAQHLLSADHERMPCSRTSTRSTWSATASAGSSAPSASTTAGSPGDPKAIFEPATSSL